MATYDDDDLFGESLAGETVKMGVGAIGKKIALTLLPYLLWFAGILLLIVIVVVIVQQIWGAVTSVVDSISSWWGRVTGTVDDDNAMVLDEIEGDQYYAKALQQALKDGRLSLSDGSDMNSLDDSDLQIIIDAVVENNEKKNEKTDIYYTWYQKVNSKDMKPGPVGSGEEIWLGTYSWKETIPRPSSKVTVSRMDVEGEMDAEGNYKFDLHWPTLIVLVGMQSYNNYENWGETGDEWNNDFEHGGDYGDMDGYYLSDDEILGLIDMLSYRFMYYYDGVADTTHNSEYNAYEFATLDKHGYKIGYEYDENDEPKEDALPEAEYHKIYKPQTAVDMIYNCYESWEYLYEPDEITGDLVCVGRKYKRDATQLVAVMEEFFPDIFEVPENYPYDPGDIFFEYLIQGLDAYLLHDDGFLPAEIVDEINQQKEYYKKLWDEYAAIRDGKMAPIEEMQTEFAGKGIHYCNGSGNSMGSDDLIHSGSESFEMDTSFQIWIGEYTNPHSGATHKVYDWYNVSEAALLDLRVSDNLSKEQITILMQYFQKRAQSQGYSLPFAQAVDALYDWQESTGYSLLGMLAIIETEGGFGKNASKGYNFFNMVAYGGDSYFQNVSGGYKWADFKTMAGGDIGVAMAEQLTRISRNYIEKNEQYNFFLFCFKGYYPDGLDQETADSSKLVHSYCPWYDDTGYITKGYDSRYGWCNKSGANRKKLASLVGK